MNDESDARRVADDAGAALKGHPIIIKKGKWKKFGITEAFVNKAKGNQGYTAKCVYIMFYNSNGEVVAPKGCIPQSSVQLINSEMKNKRASSIAHSIVDQSADISTAFYTLVGMITGLTILSEQAPYGSPLGEKDLEAFFALFKEEVKAGLRSRIFSQSWKGTIRHIAADPKYKLEGPWWNEN